MNAILVDDELANLENLQGLLQKHCPAVHIAGVATGVEQAIRLINLHQPDLLFLDIQMGKQSGFDLLQAMPDKLFEVIFVTAYDQYGIQAIKYAALDYLLKPIDIDELVQSVQKAELKLAGKKKTEQLDFLLQHLSRPGTLPSKIALPQQQEIRYVAVKDIIRCEAQNTYTYFFLVNGDKILVSGSLKEYADLLLQHGFIRSHQSHLVNPGYVKSWLKEDGGILLLVSGEKIPVSKPNRDAVREALKKGS
jgi:two-component system LytT family response regulator